MEIVIRPETPADHAAVTAVVEDAFGRRDEAQLVARLRPADGVLSLVAIADGRLVGHAMFSPVTARGRFLTPTARGLAPVAVSTKRQRSGIGSRLIDSGLQELRRAGVGLVVVLGHPSYYPRFGFAPATSLGLHCRFGGEDGAFQALELVPGAAALYRGRVDYLPAFDESAS